VGKISPWAFTYLSPVSVCTRCSPPPSSPAARPMWVDLYFGAWVSSCEFVFRRNRLAVSDLRWPVSLGTPPGGERWAWMAGWVYVWLCACTMAGVGDRRGAFLAQLFGVDRHSHRHHHQSRWCSSSITPVLNLSGTRPARGGSRCSASSANWWAAIVVGVYLLLCSPSAAQSADRHHHRERERQLFACLPRLPRSPPCSATTASKPAATWPRRRRTRPHDPEGHAHDHLHRRRCRHLVCLAFILSIPDMGAVMSGAD